MINIHPTKNYTSMFDPFREQIERGCVEGLSLKEIYEQLPEGYTYAGFYSYLRAQQLRGKIRFTAWDKKHKCDECEHCKNFVNCMGKYDRSHRICTLDWRVINHGVKHCPNWCALERGETDDK